MIIMRKFKNSEHSSEHLKDKDWNDISENPDREYMEECHKVDINRPKTWNAYHDDPMKIIEMEFNELKLAKNSKNEEIKEQLYHLSVACLNMWRHINK